MNQNTAFKRSLELMDKSETCILTTINKEGFPESRAMLNLRNTKQFPALKEVFKDHNEDLLLYFTTNTSSSKVFQLISNPAVCVYYCLPREWKGLMLSGIIEIVADKKIKEELWQNNWNMYYPQGISDPDYAILRLKPAKIKLYWQFDRFEYYAKS